MTKRKVGISCQTFNIVVETDDKKETLEKINIYIDNLISDYFKHDDENRKIEEEDIGKSENTIEENKQYKYIN